MIAIFDLDGTLSLNEHRQHFITKKPKDWKAFHAACGEDNPNIPIIHICNNLSEWGYRVYILTGRSEDVRATTKEWLAYYKVEYDGLMMRRKNDKPRIFHTAKVHHYMVGRMIAIEIGIIGR